MKTLLFIALLTTVAHAGVINTDSGAAAANGSSAPQQCSTTCDYSGRYCTTSCL